MITVLQLPVSFIGNGIAFFNHQAVGGAYFKNPGEFSTIT